MSRKKKHEHDPEPGDEPAAADPGPGESRPAEATDVPAGWDVAPDAADVPEADPVEGGLFGTVPPGTPRGVPGAARPDPTAAAATLPPPVFLEPPAAPVPEPAAPAGASRWVVSVPGTHLEPRTFTVPAGVDPQVYCAAQYLEHTGVQAYPRAPVIVPAP